MVECVVVIFRIIGRVGGVGGECLFFSGGWVVLSGDWDF